MSRQPWPMAEHQQAAQTRPCPNPNCSLGSWARWSWRSSVVPSPSYPWTQDIPGPLACHAPPLTHQTPLEPGRSMTLHLCGLLTCTPVLPARPPSLHPQPHADTGHPIQSMWLACLWSVFPTQTSAPGRVTSGPHLLGFRLRLWTLSAPQSRADPLVLSCRVGDLSSRGWGSGAPSGASVPA